MYLSTSTKYQVQVLYLTPTLVSRPVKTCSQNYLQLPIVILKGAIISDMHPRVTYMYMYINFKQIRVSRSLKTVHTNVFPNVA